MLSGDGLGFLAASLAGGPDRLAPGIRGLLLSSEYPQAEIDGPPSAAGEAEVRALSEQAFRSRLLHTLDALENNPQLAERDPSRLQEKACLLRRPCSPPGPGRACILRCRVPT
jgi:thiopurine S-methyltransferase